MIASIMLWITICGCGDQNGAHASSDGLEVNVQKDAKSNRAMIKEQKAHLRQAKKETKCIKAYVKDMKAQQQGIEQDWDQPDIEVYMKKDKCEPYLVQTNR